MGLPDTLNIDGADNATDVTVPLPLLLNVVQSVDVKYPFTELVAAAIDITGVVVPVATDTGAVPVTEVTVPVPPAAIHDVFEPSVLNTLPD